MREVVSIALVLISGFGGRIRNRLQPQAARRQVWGAVGAGVVAVTFAVRKHPNSLPVTHQLAVRSRAA
jgi:hypothetical protein